MLKLKKSDQVEVLLGKDKGKRAQIEKIFGKEGYAQVAGVNLFKKHRKALPGKPGGIFEIAKPVPMSALALVCPKCDKSTRVGFRVTVAGKVRICKKCGEQI